MPRTSRTGNRGDIDVDVAIVGKYAPVLFLPIENGVSNSMQARMKENRQFTFSSGPFNLARRRVVRLTSVVGRQAAIQSGNQQEQVEAGTEVGHRPNKNK